MRSLLQTLRFWWKKCCFLATFYRNVFFPEPFCRPFCRQLVLLTPARINSCSWWQHAFGIFKNRWRYWITTTSSCPLMMPRWPRVPNSTYVEVQMPFLTYAPSWFWFLLPSTSSIQVGGSCAGLQRVRGWTSEVLAALGSPVCKGQHFFVQTPPKGALSPAHGTWCWKDTTKPKTCHALHVWRKFSRPHKANSKGLPLLDNG